MSSEHCINVNKVFERKIIFGGTGKKLAAVCGSKSQTGPDVHCKHRTLNIEHWILCTKLVLVTIKTTNKMNCWKLNFSSALWKNVECVTRRELSKTSFNNFVLCSKMLNENYENGKRWCETREWEKPHFFNSSFLHFFLCDFVQWKKCNINALQPVNRKS